MEYDRDRIEEYKADPDLYGFAIVEDLVAAADVDGHSRRLVSLVDRHSPS
ncbi:MAG: hypothetical protein OXF41_14410 [bacterium]|nr:hypothetical protein [bacterium]